MKRIHRLLFLILLLIIVAVAWCWWNWPRKVDMAQYAPADSLVYLECNDLPAVAKSIVETDTWKKFAATLALKPGPPLGRLWSLLMSLGIGPAEGVILARAQVAIVMINLEAAEENTTLKIRPEGAIIIETHTSNWRMRSAVERALMRFAETTYGQATPKRYREEADYLEWSAPSGDRRIVAAIDRSLVVAGNSKRAVQNCLATRRGQRPALRSDSGLTTIRTRVRAAGALTFGYISAGNAARLFSWSAPVLFGREPGDSTLEQILTNRASKALGAIGWSSRPSAGGIEDRFFFALEPPIVSRLEPVFKVGPSTGALWPIMPARFDSMTIYKAENPAHAWEGLRAVTAQADALSAVVFGTLLRSALLPYGVEDPQKFLQAVGPDIATVRLQQGTGGSVLCARIRDRLALEQMFKGQTAQLRGLENAPALRYLEVSEKSFAVAFIEDYFVIGAPEDVRSCLEARNKGETIASENLLQTLTGFAPDSSSGIITYVRDEERVRNFFAAINSFWGGSMRPTLFSEEQGALSESGVRLPYAITETNLADEGIDRRTRSPFGQFSTLLALLRRN